MCFRFVALVCVCVFFFVFLFVKYVMVNGVCMIVCWCMCMPNMPNTRTNSFLCYVTHFDGMSHICYVTLCDIT